MLSHFPPLEQTERAVPLLGRETEGAVMHTPEQMHGSAVN